MAIIAASTIPIRFRCFRHLPDEKNCDGSVGDVFHPENAPTFPANSSFLYWHSSKCLQPDASSWEYLQDSVHRLVFQLCVLLLCLHKKLASLHALLPLEREYCKDEENSPALEVDAGCWPSFLATQSLPLSVLSPTRPWMLLIADTTAQSVRDSDAICVVLDSYFFFLCSLPAAQRHQHACLVAHASIWGIMHQENQTKLTPHGC